MDQEQDEAAANPLQQTPSPRRRYGSWPLSSREDRMRSQIRHYQGTLRLRPSFVDYSEDDDDDNDDDYYDSGDDCGDSIAVSFRVARLEDVAEKQERDESTDTARAPNSGVRGDRDLTWKKTLLMTVVCITISLLTIGVFHWAPQQQQQRQHNDDNNNNAAAVAPPYSVSSSPPYAHEDFLLLADKDLQAFGVTRKPGPSASDDDVAACQRQVSRAYHNMARAWHPDHCKYRAFMRPWQCEKMFQMAQARVGAAKDMCLNQKQLLEKAESRRLEEMEGRKRGKQGQS